MDDTWTSPPCLGAVPHFHADPAEGGVPLASADGHWWWDGARWTPVHAPSLEEAAAREEHPVARDARRTAYSSTTQETGQPDSTWAEAS